MRSPSYFGVVKIGGAFVEVDQLARISHFVRPAEPFEVPIKTLKVVFVVEELEFLEVLFG